MRRPGTHLDHVLIATADLDQAAAELSHQHGLTALEGGRHPGAGTANRIVPLGATYLELIAVVDLVEAQDHPRSRRVLRAVQDGSTFAAWAVRSDDIESLRAHAGAMGRRLPPPSDGSRRQADGRVLRWKTLELETDTGPSALPFCIQWLIAPDQHPGRADVAHPSAATGIARVTLGAPDPRGYRQMITDLLGDQLPIEVVRGPEPRLVSVEIATPRGNFLVS